MKIFQPMLFVGLGGTGGLVGAELERRLRVELCGPDGMALSRLSGHAPFQLPDCLQFVYADYSESDLQRLPQFNVDPSLRAAYSRTSRATHNLLPNFDSSPEVTKMLRASLREEVAGWLPPIIGEPEVTPLHNGAGQLPTVGRAALFATLRHSLAPVLEPLLQAIDAMAKAAGDLSELGGGKVNGCDVFVAFSVAGGTGAGIFLDYLHLINYAFQLRRFDGVKIYPLVVMPSSFSAATGGGREAELNAARALVDLFRLVDQQNAPSERAEIGDLDHEAKFGIRYPGTTPIRLRTGILPTAFLFSPTAGIRADDLRRSIVSLVMSLIGTELGDGRGTQGRKMATDDDYQTFAASFINRGVARSSVSPTGIGRRGVSTSLVAAMTAPHGPARRPRGRTHAARGRHAPGGTPARRTARGRRPDDPPAVRGLPPRRAVGTTAVARARARTAAPWRPEHRTGPRPARRRHAGPAVRPARRGRPAGRRDGRPLLPAPRHRQTPPERRPVPRRTRRQGRARQRRADHPARLPRHAGQPRPRPAAPAGRHRAAAQDPPHQGPVGRARARALGR
ncbi:tubulin-like doman-containing protein [Streptomyces sp. Tu 6176]|uniref:tubulin-like doman-containing protein n=1 Tax=Streptomyces sp. Tu 6176 TaxID=1470557 RepID=UPI000ADDE0D8|nr:tubulin-like doman-containing protein [Streptomyces sp. Tu 6176]